MGLGLRGRYAAGDPGGGSATARTDARLTSAAGSHVYRLVSGAVPAADPTSARTDARFTPAAGSSEGDDLTPDDGIPGGGTVCLWTRRAISFALDGCFRPFLAAAGGVEDGGGDGQRVRVHRRLGSRRKMSSKAGGPLKALADRGAADRVVASAGGSPAAGETGAAPLPCSASHLARSSAAILARNAAGSSPSSRVSRSFSISFMSQP